MESFGKFNPSKDLYRTLQAAMVSPGNGTCTPPSPTIISRINSILNDGGGGGGDDDDVMAAAAAQERLL